jgi:hypothetical protein
VGKGKEAVYEKLGRKSGREKREAFEKTRDER